MRLFACLFLLLYFSDTSAQSYFQWDEKIQQINDAVTSMRIPEAKKAIE